MGAARRWLDLCVLAALAAPFGDATQCMDGIDFNVILLDDENSPWGLQYVKGEVTKAIEEDKHVGEEEGTRPHVALRCTLASHVLICRHCVMTLCGNMSYGITHHEMMHYVV